MLRVRHHDISVRVFNDDLMPREFPLLLEFSASGFQRFKICPAFFTPLQHLDENQWPGKQLPG